MVTKYNNIEKGMRSMALTKKKHDGSRKEYAMILHEIMEKEPIVTISSDYFWNASKKAKSDGYEDMAYDEKAKSSFYYYADKCEDKLLEMLSPHYNAEEKLYNLSRIELDNIINEITLEICTRRIKLFKIPFIKEDVLYICNAYLQRIEGLLAPFSKEAEEQIIKLKEKM